MHAHQLRQLLELDLVDHGFPVLLFPGPEDVVRRGAVAWAANPVIPLVGSPDGLNRLMLFGNIQIQKFFE